MTDPETLTPHALAPHTRRELQQDSCTCGGWVDDKHHATCTHAHPSQRSCRVCQRDLGNHHSPFCVFDGEITEHHFRPPKPTPNEQAAQ